MKSTLSIKDNTPMESVSMSQYHYQPYEAIKSKRQYGDPIPSIYIPPTSKFEGTTTTGQTYKGFPGNLILFSCIIHILLRNLGQRARGYIPEVKMINRIGEHDHNTNYRVDYHPHGLTLCAAKAYAIAQKQQKTATPISAQ
jgi:hypothetical protein